MGACLRNTPTRPPISPVTPEIQRDPHVLLRPTRDARPYSTRTGPIPVSWAHGLSSFLVLPVLPKHTP